MPEPRVPQDHKKKAPPADEFFSFTVGGETYTMTRRTNDVLTAKFIRANRRRDATDYMLTAIEELAGDDKEGRELLKEFDRMTHDELEKAADDFANHVGATLGE